MSTEKYHVGCSGYYYSTWKNVFYPKGLQPRDWLAYYSTVFNTVELNGTFYRTPKLSDLQKYAAVTEKDFLFSVKMSKYITHILKLKDSKAQIDDFIKLIQDGLGEKLSNILYQLPPSFQFNAQNLELIIQNIPHDPHSIVELRHISWWNKEVEDAFKDAKITFCNVDFPGMKTYFIHTSPLFYLRLHGNPVLFKSSYSEDELREFHTHFPADAKQYYTYFNNTYYDAAYNNAAFMEKLLGLK